MPDKKVQSFIRQREGTFGALRDTSWERAASQERDKLRRRPFSSASEPHAKSVWNPVDHSQPLRLNRVSKGSVESHAEAHTPFLDRSGSYCRVPVAIRIVNSVHIHTQQRSYSTPFILNSVHTQLRSYSTPFVLNSIHPQLQLTSHFEWDEARTKTKAVMAIEERDEPIHAISQQDLAYNLLIELLAYQFAFPVRWIETQNHLFAHSNIQRFIEIGPAKVLATMAKKTSQRDFALRDMALSIERRFLAHAADRKDIYYEYDDVQEVEDVAPEAEQDTQPIATPVVSAPVVHAVSAATSSPQASVIADVPLSATDVILTIIAHKLRKPFDQILVQKSIRDLSAGKHSKLVCCDVYIM